jgi:hypothetical protein
MQNRFARRLWIFPAVAGLLFLGLVARLFYLQVNMAALAAEHGVETFHVYPVAPTLPTGAPARVRVPPLTGLPWNEAGARAAAAGLVLEGYSDLEGQVVRQVPAPGSLVEPGDPVKVWLSTQ